MIDHDLLFKELLTTFFVEFVELFLPELSAYLDPDSLVFLDKELGNGGDRGRRKRIVDIVVRARFRVPTSDSAIGAGATWEGFFLILVENQSYKQADFEKRFFHYWSRLFEKSNLPVYPIAIFSYDEPRLPEKDRFVVAFPDLRVLDFRYRVIQLNRLSWRDFVTKKNPVASALMAKMAIAPNDRWRVKLECLRLMITLRLDTEKMQFLTGFVETYLRLTAEENQRLEQALHLEDTEEEEPMTKIMTSWHLEGIEQGLQQGLQQGRQEAHKEMVLRQLQRRLRTVSEANLVRVQELSEGQLLDLADALLDFTQPSDLDNWFASRAA